MNFKLVSKFEIATMIQNSVKGCSKGEVLSMLRGVFIIALVLACNTDFE